MNKEFNVSPPESVSKKVKRHLIEILKGDVDVGALIRGMKIIRDRLRTPENLDYTIIFERREENFGNIDDLSLTTYILEDQKEAGDSYTRFTQLEYCVVDFPRDSHLQFIILDEQAAVTSYSDDIPGAIGEFVGPTVDFGYPNNGLYSILVSRQNKYIVTFGDTNPPGLRRGGMAFLDSGEVKLLNDEEKWEIVHSNFKGCTSLIGTSCYLSSEDNLSQQELTETVDVGLSILSYVFTYVDASGETRLAYIAIPHRVSRIVMYSAIETYCKSVGASSFFGVELEYNGANCHIQGDEGRYSLTQQHSKQRKDHYLVMKGK